MRTSKHIEGAVMAAEILGIAAASVVAQMEIARSTVDGGGVMHSIGGAFDLSGTIGQPDAGVLTGGPFELTGGFWFAIPPTDCNEDGMVNLLDHASFTDCLTGPAGVILADCECFEVDHSGTVDLFEVALSQIQFSTP